MRWPDPETGPEMTSRKSTNNSRPASPRHGAAQPCVIKRQATRIALAGASADGSAALMPKRRKRFKF
jgi:hypothetical protein